MLILVDAEALRRVMERYFEEMRGILERHGGTVEKFIGDAVVAAFGIPLAHEDDALRAVRAAVEMRQHLTELNNELAQERGVTLAVRTGINTGDVVAGDPAEGQFYASGDAVNVAARLEQAAVPGEIVLGEQTCRLEVRLRAGYKTLKTLGETGFLSTLAANLAQVLYWRGESEEAAALTIESESLGADDDLATQVGWRVARAMLFARCGRIREAEALAHEAVTRATAAEYFALRAESYLALGEVLRLAGRPSEASDQLEKAFHIYERKGSALSAEAVRGHLASLHASSQV